MVGTVWHFFLLVGRTGPIKYWGMDAEVLDLMGFAEGSAGSDGIHKG